MMSGFTRYADVVDWASVTDLAPREAEGFMAALAKHQVSLEAFADAYKYVEPETSSIEDAVKQRLSGDADLKKEVHEAVEEIDHAWRALRMAFADATKTEGGSFLDLQVGYYEGISEDGVIEGVYWHVEGGYRLTPAGEQFSSIITREFYWVD